MDCNPYRVEHVPYVERLESRLPSLVDLLVIQQIVTEEFDVHPTDLHSRRRTRSVVVPRQICMYLPDFIDPDIVVLTGFPLDQHAVVTVVHRNPDNVGDIGSYLGQHSAGKQDHTAQQHAHACGFTIYLPACHLFN